MQSEAFLGIISGPIQGHRKQPLALFLGPLEDIGKVFQLTFWAHPMQSEAFLGIISGPIQGHRKQPLALISGPIRGH